MQHDWYTKIYHKTEKSASSNFFLTSPKESARNVCVFPGGTLRRTKEGASVERRYDVLIVGGGVVGCAIARELSRYRVRTALLDRERDVGLGTSCRNSGVLHSGINYTPGTLRARLAVEGNRRMHALCRDLRVKCRTIGKLTVAQDEEDTATLARLLEQGTANGVPGLRILWPEEMRRLQPGVEGIRALHSPSSGIVSPYALTVALAENAVTNGVHVHLGQEVLEIRPRLPEDGGGFVVRTAAGDRFIALVVVNAAGVFADRVAALAGIPGFRIYPCRGEYYVLDKRFDGVLRTLVYPAPRPRNPGLGIHLTPTVDGNILIGPSAEYVEDPGDLACTAAILRKLQEKGRGLLPDLAGADFIRSFAGIRAKQSPPEEGGTRDYIIEDRKDVKGFINLVGIESPGLTASPAIAVMVAEMVGHHLPLEEKKTFVSCREGRREFFCELSTEEKAALVAEDPEYGEVVCRCEGITRREVLDALANPLGARTLVSLKYRARVTMGRCQGGFCLPRIVRILRDEFGYAPEDYLLRGGSSPLFVGRVREDAEIRTPVPAEGVRP